MKGKDEKLSPSGRRKRSLVEHQRADILAAASRAFAENGLNGTPIGAIASAAQVSLATLYSLFQSKEALYREIVIKAAASVRDNVFNRVGEVEDPVGRLLVFVEALLYCYQENREFMILYVHATQGFPYRIRAELGEEALDIFQDVTARLVETAREARNRGKLAKDIDPEALAYSIMGAVVTTCSQWVERDEPRSLEAAAPALVAIFRRVLDCSAEKGAPRRTANGGRRKKAGVPKRK